jgi:metal-responsive CopG/Arc/MetJ family transcriptional regulator
MPNKPRPENPARPVRIEDKLWAEVQALATADETSASEVVREAVRRYVKARKRHEQRDKAK